MKKKILKIIVCVILVGVVLAGFSIVHKSNAETTDTAATAGYDPGGGVKP
ncbi:hypothetical protein [Heyndrickxia camelliae]|nr:hypothetical protein [Heyndrickxia camelliae]